MTRDTCKYPTCDRNPGEQNRDDYRDAWFCSLMHELKYEHIRADARDARMAEEAELENAMIDP